MDRENDGHNMLTLVYIAACAAAVIAAGIARLFA